MGRIVVTEFVSLDGVMKDPRWTFGYWNDEIANFKGEESDASDALLLGRVTYPAPLNLLESQSFGSGVVALVYDTDRRS